MLHDVLSIDKVKTNSKGIYFVYAWKWCQPIWQQYPNCLLSELY